MTAPAARGSYRLQARARARWLAADAPRCAAAAEALLPPLRCGRTASSRSGPSSALRPPPLHTGGRPSPLEAAHPSAWRGCSDDRALHCPAISTPQVDNPAAIFPGDLVTLVLQGGEGELSQEL